MHGDRSGSSLLISAPSQCIHTTTILFLEKETSPSRAAENATSYLIAICSQVGVVSAGSRHISRVLLQDEVSN